MPPLPFEALFALYWSRQVCMRALPADSFEYFGSIALGNTAPEAAVEVADFTTGLLSAFVSVAAAGPAHSAFRYSPHVLPFKVPAAFADWYLTLHSLAVSAELGPALIIAAAASAVAERKI